MARPRELALGKHVDSNIFGHVTAKLLLAEYAQKQHLYKAFAEDITQLLTRILNRHEIAYHSVTCREKSTESLRVKLENPEKQYTRLEDVTDLAGVRLTTYFHDDVDRAAAIVEAEFDVDKVNSVDKRQSLDPDQFGYASVHYVVELSPVRRELAENHRFAGFKVEIQLRSLLQHAWAEIEHDLGYKSASSVPKHIRRRFARLAGLLELADSEFVAIRNELAEYQRGISSQIRTAPDTVGLDRTSLAAFIQQNLVVARLDQAIAVAAGRTLVERDEESTEHLLGRMLFLGFATVADVEAKLSANEDKLVRFVQRFSIGSTSTDSTFLRGISLWYLAFLLLGQQGDHSRILEYLTTGTIGETATRAQLAERIVRAWREADAAST